MISHATGRKYDYRCSNESTYCIHIEKKTEIMAAQFHKFMMTFSDESLPDDKFESWVEFVKTITMKDKNWAEEYDTIVNGKNPYIEIQASRRIDNPLLPIILSTYMDKNWFQRAVEEWGGVTFETRDPDNIPTETADSTLH